ncbi:MAG: phosphate-starvation-inducible PsiE family protein [Syntrophobacterales bacterium]|nr:phosphate-starvation-inducible PsiE family protein [Syntrophobacterales bacterium]
MGTVILWGIGDVVWILYNQLMSPPFLLLNINDILATFGAFMAVLIAIDIFINITFPETDLAPCRSPARAPRPGCGPVRRRRSRRAKRGRGGKRRGAPAQMTTARDGASATAFGGIFGRKKGRTAQGAGALRAATW